MISTIVQKTRCLWTNLMLTAKPYNGHGGINLVRWSSDEIKCSGPGNACRKAVVDIPPKGDPECPKPCKDRRKKKSGILHKIKLRVLEGGSNFGTPFRRLRFKHMDPDLCDEKELKPKPKPETLPAPKRKEIPVPDPRPGVQVSIIGADTAIGQYVALLLKQCQCIKKLRLYEAQDTSSSECSRSLYNVTEDLKHIDTNCLVQAFSCCNSELELCLQNSDIVLLLESAYANVEMPLEKRFYYQAPMIKKYTDAIATECPKAFIIVCATPIDCMVPLIAETMKETGWYDPRKLLGSIAVPEMRASTLAARALCLEPRYTRVPCVGGTEGEALVPLFSKAVEYFDFNRRNAELLTETVRSAPLAVARAESCCMRTAELSEAHAVAGLVTSVANALLCKDLPRVSGFVETDAGHVISPARFIATKVEINGSGIVRNLGLPKMSETEITQVNLALIELCQKLRMVYDWNNNYMCVEMLLDKHGISRRFDIPGQLNDFELDMMDRAFAMLECNVKMAHNWYCQQPTFEMIGWQAKTDFNKPARYQHVNECSSHLTG